MRWPWQRRMSAIESSTFDSYEWQARNTAMWIWHPPPAPQPADTQVPYKHEPRDLEFHHRDYQVHDAMQRGYWPALLAKRIAAATAAKFA